jgi:uncharacterized protein YbjT (DUF2867 family)
MKILIFGATGMVGEGVLRWLFTSPDVNNVVAVSRKPLAVQHAKLEVVIEPDMFQLQTAGSLNGFDACFFCLGPSSIGMSEAQYYHQTHDLTLAIGRQLLVGNPDMVFEYISGGRAALNSRQMWCRVKAKTEDAVLKIGFHDSYALRPGFIQPMRGTSSRHRAARWLYAATDALYPLLQKRFNRAVTSTDLLARAMLQLALAPSPQKILSNGELNELATDFQGPR